MTDILIRLPVPCHEFVPSGGGPVVCDFCDDIGDIGYRLDAVYAHEPLRLSVCIEAPVAAINDVLERHSSVRALFDNRWLHLLTLDGEGRMPERYTGDLGWSALNASSERNALELVA